IKKEKEGLDSKLTGLESAAKDLNTLLGSQRTDKNKEGLGYSVVPPLAQVYSPPKKYIIESNTSGLQNSDSSVSDYEESSESIMSKPMIKFVKAADCAEVKTNKVEAARKPSVKYAEMYRNTSKSPKVRGNQRNWNNLKTQQLGKDFVMKKKASFKCGHFDHLAYDCRVWVEQGKNRPNNNFAHKNVTPRADLFKTASVSAARRVNTAAPRPNVNSA
nr:ubiquitin hydrolase [Tanacetum cinerariifolium]